MPLCRGSGMSVPSTGIGLARQPRPSGRKHARKREADRLGKNLDGIRVMVGLELGKVDRRLAADEDATDETRPVPGDPVALGIHADDEMGAPDLHEGRRYLMTHLRTLMGLR